MSNTSNQSILRWLLPAAGVLVLAPVAVLGAVAGAIAEGISDLPADANPSSLAVADIPPAMLALYEKSASACPGLSWTVLAGIGKVESDHNRPPSQVSAAGAQGPMQFLPATWAQYGVDGDGDGVADPFNPADAIPATAAYLCALGADKDTPTAIAAYNCGGLLACREQAIGPGGYASRVLDWARRYAASSLTITGGSGGPAAEVAVQTALAQVGTPYRWGGESTSGFDCSGLVQYSYRSAGITLPRTAQTQHDAGPLLPDGTTPIPGDLVFFGSSLTHITHVGIALGEGRMVDAPHTGAFVRVEPIAGFHDLLGATRPTALPAAALSVLPAPDLSAPTSAAGSGGRS